MRLKPEASLSFVEESALKDKMTEINKHTLSNEQYSRKSSVRLFGKPEEEGEGTERKAVKFFKNVLKVDIKPEDIDMAHQNRQSPECYSR